MKVAFGYSEATPAQLRPANIKGLVIGGFIEVGKAIESAKQHSIDNPAIWIGSEELRPIWMQLDAATIESFLKFEQKLAEARS